MKRGLILIFLLLSSCSTGLLRPAATPPPDIEAVEYTIYSALIRQNPIGYNLGDSFVVREQTTADLDLFERTLENVRKLPSSLVDSYRSRNASSYTLDLNLDIAQDYVLMPQEEFDQIFRKGGSVWTRFEEKYPEASGFIVFSRVGFNAKGDKALATMGYRCGDLCGAGGLYLLIKKGDSWKVQSELMVWQS